MKLSGSRELDFSFQSVVTQRRADSMLKRRLRLWREERRIGICMAAEYENATYTELCFAYQWCWANVFAD